MKFTAAYHGRPVVSSQEYHFWLEIVTYCLVHQWKLLRKSLSWVDIVGFVCIYLTLWIDTLNHTFWAFVVSERKNHLITHYCTPLLFFPTENATLICKHLHISLHLSVIQTWLVMILLVMQFYVAPYMARIWPGSPLTGHLRSIDAAAANLSSIKSEFVFKLCCSIILSISICRTILVCLLLADSKSLLLWYSAVFPLTPGLIAIMLPQAKIMQISELFGSSEALTTVQTLSATGCWESTDKSLVLRCRSVVRATKSDSLMSFCIQT